MRVFSSEFFCKMFLLLVVVENFSDKSSSGALLSLKKNKTVFFFFKLWPIYIRLTHFCEENIQMRIYIENAHVFFSLLATAGAASPAQMRRFSLQFFEIHYQKPCVSIFFHTNPRLIYFNTYFTL